MNGFYNRDFHIFSLDIGSNWMYRTNMGVSTWVCWGVHHKNVVLTMKTITNHENVGVPCFHSKPDGGN